MNLLQKGEKGELMPAKSLIKKNNLKRQKPTLNNI
jgi:hypothetical protein